MKHMLFGVVVLACVAVWLTGLSNAEQEKPFAPNVDVATGALRVPDNYTDWPTLGTWANANTDEKLEKNGPGLHEYHTVYTQPSTIAHYKKTGQFPDGAVLVKELLNAETMASHRPCLSMFCVSSTWLLQSQETLNANTLRVRCIAKRAKDANSFLFSRNSSHWRNSR